MSEQLNLLHGTDVREASTDDGPSALEWFLGELDRMDGCRDTKERVRDLLRRMAGHRMFLAKGMLVTPERLRMASALLDAGFTATNVWGYLWLGLAGTAVAYSLWFRGIGRLPASVVT